MKRLNLSLLLFLVCTRLYSLEVRDAAGIWSFSESLGLHHPVLFLHDDQTFEMEQYGEDHIKGEGSVYGEWSLTDSLLTLDFEDSMCCQFEPAEKVVITFTRWDSTGADIVFREKEAKLTLWKPEY